MTTLREAAQLALDALESNHQWHINYDDYDRYPESELADRNLSAITALRQALAEPEQPARVPLTQPDKQRLWNDACHNNRSSANDAAMEFGTLVEAAHGIMPVCFGPHDPVQE